MRPTNLRSRASIDVPLSEISGLGQRPTSPEGPGQVLAVGDEDFTVVAGSSSFRRSPGTVFVLSPELDHLLHTIELSLETDEALDCGDDPNAQGEGLVLLHNGHVLIAKEKDPPMLLEFGPRGCPSLSTSPRNSNHSWTSAHDGGRKPIGARPP